MESEQFFEDHSPDSLVKNSVLFANTQVQESEDFWRREDEKSQRIGSLSRFSYDKDIGEAEIRSDIFKPVKKQKKTRKPRAGKSKAKASEKESILRLLSGKKRKINDILNEIEKVEQGGPEGQEIEAASELEAASEAESNSVPAKAPAKPKRKGRNSPKELENLVYTKDEWFNLLKIIRINFPFLSAKSKKTLGTVNKYYEKQYNEEQQDPKLSQKSTQDSNVPNSLWKMASALPETKLTLEDLKWLYDVENPSQDYEVLASAEAEEADLSNGEYFVSLSQLVKNEDQPNPADAATPEKQMHTVIEIPSSSPRASPIKTAFDPAIAVSDTDLSDNDENFEIADGELVFPKEVNQLRGIIQNVDVFESVYESSVMANVPQSTQRPVFSNTETQTQSQSVYSTAISRVQSQAPAKSVTTRYEFKGKIEKLAPLPFSNCDTVLKHEKRELEPELVPDSESESDQDVSIIEITWNGKEDDVKSNKKAEQKKKVEEKFTMDQLRKLVAHWNLKRSRSKKSMNETVDSALSVLQIAPESVNFDKLMDITQPTVEAAFQKRISELVKQNVSLHKQILTYEPVLLTEMCSFLNSEGLDVDTDTVRGWCEKYSVTYSQRT